MLNYLMVGTACIAVPILILLVFYFAAARRDAKRFDNHTLPYSDTCFFTRLDKRLARMTTLFGILGALVVVFLVCLMLKLLVGD